MYRDLSLALVLFAVAATAAAECSDSHGARNTITDDQAQATQAPVKKAAVAPAAAKKALACEGTCADKTAQAKKPTRNAVALARDAAPSGDKPAN